MVIFLLIHGLLRRSYIGWAFRALRDDEIAAELTGSTYSFTEGRISLPPLGLARSTLLCW